MNKFLNLSIKVQFNNNNKKIMKKINKTLNNNLSKLNLPKCRNHCLHLILVLQVLDNPLQIVNLILNTEMKMKIRFTIQSIFSTLVFFLFNESFCRRFYLFTI